MASSIKETTIEKLKGSENYITWKYAITALLKFSDLEKTIDPTESTREKDPKKLKQAKAKIVLCIDPHLYVHITECTTAIEIWQKLQSMFEDKGLSRRIGLLRKLITTTLNGCSSMDEYICEVIGTANKLNGIGFAINEEWVGSFLLAGLTDEYKPFIMGIESSNTKITGDTIKSRLIEMGNINQSTDTAMYTKSAKRGKEKSRSTKIKCYECGKIGHTRSECWSREKERDNKRTKDKKSLVSTSQTAFSPLTALCAMNKNERENTFYVDSGASQHMCSGAVALENVRRSTTKSILTASGNRLEVKHIGDLTLHIEGNKIDVNDILCVPDIAANLLSVSTITAGGNKVSFIKDGCVIVNTKGEYICKANLSDGVYTLKALTPIATATTTIHPSAALLSKQSTDIVEWHRKMGHLNFFDLIKLKDQLNSSMTRKDIPKCTMCLKAKQPRFPFPYIGSRAKNILDIIHSDLCGPFQNLSIGKARYFLTFIDDHTRKVFVYFLKRKNETFRVFQEFKAMVETQTGRKIKILRSDNGTEYVNGQMDALLKRHGILHQTTMPHTPEQNGLAEKMNRTLIEKAKAMIFDSGLHLKFWAEAVNTAAYLVNRSPARATGKPPQELWLGTPVQFQHLQIFGVDAMAHVPKANRRKLDPKSKSMIFVGYCENSKGYRLYNPDTDKIVVSRDVVFLDKFNGNLEPTSNCAQFIWDEGTSIDDDNDEPLLCDKDDSTTSVEVIQTERTTENQQSIYKQH